MSNIYYVYAYLRASDNSPYYIGKGKGNRAYHNNHSVPVPKDKTKIIFLEENLLEEEALRIEKEYISKYGRKDNGTGILRNLTDGGEGVSGRVMSKEQKNKLREHLKSGQHKLWTEQINKKVSKTQKRLVKEGKHLFCYRNEIYGNPNDIKVECPHCGKVGAKPGMMRHHFNKCKSITM